MNPNNNNVNIQDINCYTVPQLIYIIRLIIYNPKTLENKMLENINMQQNQQITDKGVIANNLAITL
jgi:hypothetical protein